MFDVITEIERRKHQIAAHPFYHWIAHGPAPLAKRFDFAPLLVNFIMGFSDMNRWFMRYGAASSDHQRAINRHTREDETHSRLFIEDWRKLGLDRRLGWTAGDTLAWYHAAPRTEALRAHGLEILGMLTEHEDPLLRFALMESIEAWGHVMFSATTHAATELSETTGVEYRYFGLHHLRRELGHLSAGGELFAHEVLDERRRAQALALVGRLFDIAEAESDTLLAELLPGVDQAVGAGLSHVRVQTVVVPGGARADAAKPHATVSDGHARLCRLLDERKRAAARHPLLAWMQSERGLTALDKLRQIALFWAPDCLGYRDLNAHALGYANPGNPRERALQRRVAGLVTHHQLFLRDWAALDMDEQLGFSASDTLEFYCRSMYSETQRRSMATFLELAFRHRDPKLRYWLIEALEASGHAFFATTQQLALAAEDMHGVRLDYFADRHDLVHPVLQPDPAADAVQLASEPLDAEQEEAAASIIEAVFERLAIQESASLELATAGRFLPTSRPRSFGTGAVDSNRAASMIVGTMVHQRTRE